MPSHHSDDQVMADRHADQIYSAAESLWDAAGSVERAVELLDGTRYIGTRSEIKRLMDSLNAEAKGLEVEADRLWDEAS